MKVKLSKYIAMLLAITLLFTGTGEIFASELLSSGNSLQPELELATGLQEAEVIAIPEDEMTGEVYDYRELAEISTYSAVYGSEWDKYSTNYYYNQLSPEWKTFWDAMDAVCASYMNSQMIIDEGMLEAVSTPSGMTGSELKMLWELFVYSNPQYYFLSNAYSFSYITSRDLPTSIILRSYDAFCDGNARAEATAAVKAQIEDWEAELKNCTSDEEKVKKIFDLLCNKVTYNNAAANGQVTEQTSFSQSAYSALCLDTTVCAGYADTMTIMCNGAGIDCVSVTSANHQWNKIRINDSWYNYDATWGDQNSGIYYQYYARNDASYQNDGSSHWELDFWETYSPKSTLDATPSSAWEDPGTYPVIVNKTAMPNIEITQTDGTYLVTITCSTDNADIYYTLDGTEPSAAFTKSVKYTEPFVMETTPQVKAIAVRDTYFDSDIASAEGEEIPEPEVFTYTITYELNGGTNHINNPATYQSNITSFVLCEPTREGYTFAGWYYDSLFVNPVTEITGDSGNITVHAKWLKNYISIESANVVMSSYFVYDGTEKIPELSVYLNGEKLTLHTDYEVSYANNINAGTATVTITGIGDYNGTMSKDYTIEPASMYDAVVTLSELNFIYDGTAHTPEVYVQVGDLTLEKNIDYELNYTNNVNVGIATVTITGKGNYAGSIARYFNIVEEEVNTYLVVFNANGGENPSESIRYVEENRAIGTLPTVQRDGYTFKGWYTDASGGTQVTENTVITQGVTFYAQWEKVLISIDKATIKLSSESFVYDGTEKKPEVIVTLEGKTLREGTDYVVDYTDNIAAGTAAVIISGQGNYDGSISKTYIINAASIEYAKVTLSATIYNYDGKAKTPSVTVMLGDKKLAEGDYVVTYENNKNIGTAIVTITGKGSYTGNLTKTFTIKLGTGKTFTSGKYKYKVTGSSSVAFNGIASTKTTKVSIPKTVKYGGKTFKVTSVADKALKGKSKVTQITIGANVTKIGTSSFEGCKKLSKVSMGSAVTTIEDKAFKNCTALKSIMIPGKVTKIDKQAFYGCKNLKTITIKSTKLETVGSKAFKGINSKATIKVPKSKFKSYQKLLKGKGQGSRVKVVKY